MSWIHLKPVFVFLENMKFYCPIIFRGINYFILTYLKLFPSNFFFSLGLFSCLYFNYSCKKEAAAAET